MCKTEGMVHFIIKRVNLVKPLPKYARKLNSNSRIYLLPWIEQMRQRRHLANILNPFQQFSNVVEPEQRYILKRVKPGRGKRFYNQRSLPLAPLPDPTPDQIINRENKKEQNSFPHNIGALDLAWMPSLKTFIDGIDAVRPPIKRMKPLFGPNVVPYRTKIVEQARQLYNRAKIPHNVITDDERELEMKDAYSHPEMWDENQTGLIADYLGRLAAERLMKEGKFERERD